MNILIVNPFGIGDVLFSSPLIHTLKEKFPHNKLGYLCNKRTEPLLRNNPLIDRIFSYERDDYKRLSAISPLEWLKEFNRFIRQIRKEKFGAAIDLSLATNFGFFLWLAGIKSRVGYNYKNRGFYLTKSISFSGYDAKHIVDYYGDVLRLIDVAPKHRDLELYLKEEDKLCAERIFRTHNITDKKVPVIAIAPCGGASWGKDAKLKHWPIEKYAELADKILEKYKAKVIMLADSNEKENILELDAKVLDKIINLAGQTTLTELAAIIDRADLVIANDGGPLHIAAALGKKTVSFFGPVDPKVYGPYPPDEKRHIVLREPLDCSPCYRRFRLSECKKNRECLERITVDKAMDAVVNLLGDFK